MENFEEAFTPKEEKQEKKGTNVFRNAILTIVVVTALATGFDYVKSNTIEAKQEKEKKEFFLKDYKSLRTPDSNKGYGDIEFNVPAGHSKIKRNGEIEIVGSDSKVKMNIINEKIEIIDDTTGIAKEVRING